VARLTARIGRKGASGQGLAGDPLFGESGFGINPDAKTTRSLLPVNIGLLSNTSGASGRPTVVLLALAAALEKKSP
jgi:hypothetical protein